MFKVSIHVNLTSELMPDPHVLVIIPGGLAVWTGSVWLSKTGDDNCRVIEWTIPWWTPIIRETDIRYLPECVCY